MKIREINRCPDSYTAEFDFRLPVPLGSLSVSPRSIKISLTGWNNYRNLTCNIKILLPPADLISQTASRPQEVGTYAQLSFRSAAQCPGNSGCCRSVKG